MTKELLDSDKVSGTETLTKRIVFVMIVSYRTVKD